jgi:hypothetical protein
LSPGGTANGEGPAAEGAGGEVMAPARSWVKEPWKAGEGMSGKSEAASVSGPGLVPAAEPAAAAEAKKESMAARGGRESGARCGGRRGPSPLLPAEAWCAAMGKVGAFWGVCVGRGPKIRRVHGFRGREKGAAGQGRAGR